MKKMCMYCKSKKASVNGKYCYHCYQQSKSGSVVVNGERINVKPNDNEIDNIDNKINENENVSNENEELPNEDISIIFYDNEKDMICVKIITKQIYVVKFFSDINRAKAYKEEMELKYNIKK